MQCYLFFCLSDLVFLNWKEERMKSFKITEDNSAMYDLTWTTDDVHWMRRQFADMDELREFAIELEAANEDNLDFAFYGRRYEAMNTCDMLDRCICAAKVRLARFA